MKSQEKIFQHALNLYQKQQILKSIEIIKTIFNNPISESLQHRILDLLKTQISWAITTQQIHLIVDLFNLIHKSPACSIYFLQLEVEVFAYLKLHDHLNLLLPLIKSYPYQATDVQFLIQFATIFQSVGNIQIALELFNLGLQKNPTSEKLLEDFTNFLIQNRMYELNSKIVNYAIKLYPNNPNLLENLGIAYFSQKDLNNSINTFVQTLNLPNVSDLRKANVFNNLGTALVEINQLDKASECYSKALELNPNHELAKLNSAGFLLLKGDYLKGFEYYESRLVLKQEEYNRLNISSVKTWSFLENNPNGEVILLYPEQGLGDLIQMSRYFKQLKAFNPNNQLWLACPKPLRFLFEQNFLKTAIFDQIIEIEQAELFSSKIQSKLSIMSLPHLFQTTIDTIPNQMPYLSIDENLITQWKHKIQEKISLINIQHQPLKVGLAWLGSTLHQKNTVRSLTDNQIFNFINQFINKNIVFFTIHKSNTPNLIHNQLINICDDIQDFSDLGAVMHNLDLIISVDSAPVHLAGSLNIPTWALIYTPCDWRWYIHEQTKSIWYDSVQLYRQPTPSDWNSVLNQLQIDLNYII